MSFEDSTLGLYDVAAVEATLQIATNQMDELVMQSTRHIETDAVYAKQPPSSRQIASSDLTARIRRLDSIAHVCRLATSKFARLLAYVERAQHDCQLALVPISALPPEVLTTIFQYAILSPSPQSSPSKIVLLSQVCSRWRAVADAYSALWTDFTINQHMSAVVYNRHLDHAKDRLLRLTVRDKIPVMPYSLSERCPQNVEHLNWTSNTLIFDTFLQRYPILLSQLKILTLDPVPICSLCRRSEPCVISRRPLHFAQLEHLSLSLVRLDRLRLTAPLLTSLSLEYVEGRMSDLDALLSGLPTLESLTIEGPADDIYDITGESMSFKLPRLTALALRDVGFREASALLVSTKYPVLRNFGFVHRDGFAARNVRAMIRRFLRGCRSLEEVVAECHRRVLSGVLQGIDPYPPKRVASNQHFAPSTLILPAPILRALSVSVTPYFRDEEDHDEQEHSVLRDIERVVRLRKLRGSPSLDVLDVHQCTSCSCNLITLLKKMVGTLTVEECFDVYLAGSDSEGDEEVDDDDDNDDDDSEGDSDD